MMKTTHWIVIGSVSAVVAVAIVRAAISIPTRTFRTTAALIGFEQDHDQVTGDPQYDQTALAGHDLVNLVLGTPLDTLRTNEVLALLVDCVSSNASLIVWDKTASSAIATIATNTRIDVVTQQDKNNPGPNRERFVAQFNLKPGGAGSNALLGGFLTVAGRLHLDPTNGCPRAVKTDTDRRLDRLLGERDAKNTDDKDKITLIAGRAHVIGVIDLVSDGNTSRVLIPSGWLTIRRQLDPQP